MGVGDVTIPAMVSFFVLTPTMVTRMEDVMKELRRTINNQLVTLTQLVRGRCGRCEGGVKKKDLKGEDVGG